MAFQAPDSSAEGPQHGVNPENLFGTIIGNQSFEIRIMYPVHNGMYLSLM